jgi:hypothetical protein
VLVDIWIDPACPWCWLTSRWLVDVAPHRELDVQWRSISLLRKNGLEEGSPYYDVCLHTHRLLRVLEAVKDAHGNAAAGELYAALGRRIHQGQEGFVEAATALTDIGLDPGLAHAFDDDRWDATIEASMAEGLGLVGDDVGTPIIGLSTSAGERVGFFGPVISRRPPLEQALQLWDGIALAAAVPGFWELKRTRTEGPAAG